MRILLKQNDASLKRLFDDYLTSCKAKGLAKETVSSYEQLLKTLGISPKVVKETYLIVYFILSFLC